MSELAAGTMDRDQPKTSAWWRILLIGLVLFGVSVLVFAVTGNPNLFPTVALIGNFLVPISYVAFFYERRHMSQVTLVSTARAFFYGGVLGVFAAALLEPLFIQRLTFSSAFVDLVFSISGAGFFSPRTDEQKR